VRTNYGEPLYDLFAVSLVIVAFLIAIGVFVRITMEAMGVW